MTPYTKLTEREIELIDNYRKDYAVGDEQNFEVHFNRMAPVEYILREWNQQKERLFNVFKQNLIIEFEENVEYSWQEKTNILFDEIFDKCSNDFWWKMSYAIPYEVFAKIDIIDNIYDGETKEVTCRYSRTHIEPIFRDIKFIKGMKAMKLFAKVAKAFGWEEDFEHFRCQVSQLGAYKSKRVKICLSIHPLDYMTMSDNEEGWESCMSWYYGGEYRLGTVEMMNSPYVVVAYVPSENNTYYNWNSKRWRSLYICGQDFIRSIKGYPYFNEKYDKVIINKLAKLYKEAEAYDFAGYQINKIVSGDIHCRVVSSHMYNDTLYSDGFGIGNYLTEGLFNYSGEATCMICGDIIEHGDTARVSCESCTSTTYYCAHCDCTIYEGDEVFYDGEAYCHDCYVEYFCKPCAMCGEVTEDYTTFELYDSDGYCHNIYLDYNCAVAFKEKYSNAPSWNIRGSWADSLSVEDLTEEDRKLIF